MWIGYTASFLNLGEDSPIPILHRVSLKRASDLPGLLPWMPWSDRDGMGRLSRFFTRSAQLYNTEWQRDLRRNSLLSDYEWDHRDGHAYFKRELESEKIWNVEIT